MTQPLRLSQFILGWRRQSINLQSSFTTPRPSKHCCNFRIQTQYHQRFLSSSSSTSSIDNELAQLRSEISSLTYLIKQSSIQQDETQALARRAEALLFCKKSKKLLSRDSRVLTPLASSLEVASFNICAMCDTYATLNSLISTPTLEVASFNICTMCYTNSSFPGLISTPTLKAAESILSCHGLVHAQ